MTSAQAGRSIPWGFALKILASAGVVAVLVYRFDFHAILEKIEGANLLYVAAGFFLLLLQTVLLAWRWMLINRLIDKTKARLPNLVLHWRLYMVSLWFNLVLPSSIGGDAVRAWMIKSAHLTLSTAAKGVIYDRISALLAVILMIAASLPLIWQLESASAISSGLQLIAVSSGVGFLLLLALPIITRWLPQNLLKHRFAAALFSLALEGARVLRAPVIMAKAMLIHIITILSFFCIIRSVAIPVELIQVAAIMPAVILLSALPISIAGWGVRESSIVVGLGLFAIDPASALAASILFGLCATMVGLIGGPLWLLERTLSE